MFEIISVPSLIQWRLIAMPDCDRKDDYPASDFARFTIGKWAYYAYNAGKPALRTRTENIWFQPRKGVAKTADAQIILAKLALAAVCGGIIGFQRERQDRPAGFRTHILVSLGSALFMIVSMHPFAVPSDPTRIAAQVVTGIGFLGAGTIIRQGNYIVGLTTAASLWSVSAVGLAAGAGFYTAAIGGAVLIFLVLSFFKVVEARFVIRKPDYTLTVCATSGPDIFPTLKKIMTESELEVAGTDIFKNDVDQLEFVFKLKAQSADAASDMVRQISQLEAVTRVRLEEPPESGSQLFGAS